MKRSLNQLLALAVVSALVVGGCKPSDSDGGGGSAGRNGPSSGAVRPEPKAAGNSAGDTVKIGIVASLNGELRPWGIDSLKGAELAVKEANDAGGIQGKKIELLQGDSASKPEQGKSAAEKLISDGVIGIAGEVASGITAQIAKSAFEAGVPVLAIGATRTDLAEIGSNYFRVCYTDDFQGPVMAKFAYEELGLRNVAIMTDKKQPYSKGLSDAFRAAFTKLGGTIADEQFYDSGATQFAGQLTNLKARNPDGLFMSGYFTEVGPIARQAREAGLNVKLLGGDGWDSKELTTSGGEAIIGGYFCNHYNDKESRPEVQEFLTKFRAMHGAPPATTMGALGYDAVKLMIDALRRASELNSRALIRALDETEGFAGVSGVITLKGHNGNPPKRALVVEVTPQGQAFRKAYEFDDVF